MLEAISPSAIEISLQFAEDFELKHRQLHSQWKQRLEQAAHDTGLARRRYEIIDPENRLVALTLERIWDAALAAEQKLCDDHNRAVQRKLEQSSEADKVPVRSLAGNPALGNAPSTTDVGRQAIARFVLEHVIRHTVRLKQWQPRSVENNLEARAGE